MTSHSLAGHVPFSVSQHLLWKSASDFHGDCTG